MFGTSTPAEVFGMGKLASPAKEPCGNTGGEGGVSALGGGRDMEGISIVIMASIQPPHSDNTQY